MEDISGLQRRARGYLYLDGIQEAAAGVALTVYGALILVAALTRAMETRGSVAVWALVALAVIGLVIVRLIRSRVTYPRTGYVKQSPRGRIAAGLVGGALAVFAMPLIEQYVSGGAVNVSWALMAIAAWFAAAVAWQGWRTGLRRSYVVAAVVVLTGAAVALAGLTFQVGLGALVLAYGLGLLATGTLAFMRYLRNNPTAQAVDPAQ